MPLKFLPDADPATPEVLTSVSGFIPTIRGGYKAAPSGTTAGIAALNAACTGASLGTDLSGTATLYAGTDTQIFSSAGTSWTDVSRAGNYSTGSIWRFVQFGNVALATNYVDVLQFSTGGAFANIGAAVPKAKYITTTAANFVLIANTNEATFGPSPNRWWCSGLADYTDWTPSATTQCSTNILVDTPGAITGFGKIGDHPVLFKERSLYLGVYQDAPLVWDWTLISDVEGAPTQEAIVNTGTVVYFLGADNFYAFDGTQPVKIGEGIREWFFANRSSAYRDVMASHYDAVNQRIYWFYVSSAATTKDSWVCFEINTSRWGAGSLAVEAVASFRSISITYANIGNYFSSYAATMPAYDSLFWNQGSLFPAYFDTTHTLQMLAGAAGSNSITTGDIGDEFRRSFVGRVTPSYLVNPTSATLTPYTRMRRGDTLVAQTAVTQDSRKRFDFRQSSRWHRYKLATVGDAEITGLITDMRQEGKE